MAATANTLPRDIPFVTFSAANDAAILLFELIQAKASPPNLVSDGNSIGFQISLPLASDSPDSGGSDAASETSSDAGPGSNLMEWDIGAGTSPAMVDKGLVRSYPPILLCPPGASPASHAVRKHIKDFHACIFVHPSSGVLMLKTFSNRPIIYEQGDIHDNDLKLGLDEWRNGIITCALRKECNYINIGPYRFLVKFATQSRETYRSLTAYINEHVKREYHGLVPSNLFNFSPMTSPYNTTRWNVWLHQQIPTTDITTGVNIHTGQPVAIKRLRNRNLFRSRQNIVKKLQMALQNKDKQEGGILGIIDVWCDHQISPPCLFNAQYGLSAECQHTYYSMPLASYSFLDLPWPKLQANMRLLYLHQTLSALAELHGRDLVHGNIRPGSLLILGHKTRKLRLNTESLASQKVVLSLSMSRIEKAVFDGTEICVPPEVWQNSVAATDLDGTKLDIWAMAASWLYAFATLKNRKIATRDTHEWLLSKFDRIFESKPYLAPFINLLRKMLAWEPQDRPTVAEALASDAWQLVWTEKQKEEDMKKQKRKDKMQSDGVKRVRVLSPEKEDYRVFES